MLGSACILIAFYLLLTRRRYPDAPVLSISTKPGLLGVLEDTATSVTDIMSLLDVGWHRYSKHGVNYLLNVPQEKLYIVAPKYFEEIRRAPDSHLMQLGHTLHKRLMWDQYHFEIPVRKSLTQSLGPKLPDIVEEAKLSLIDYIGDCQDWKPLPMSRLSFDVITRTANRLLFGPDLARDSEFQDLSIDYTNIMFGGANAIRNYPEILKPIMMWWKTDIYKAQALARKHLVPILNYRIAEEDRYIAMGEQDKWQKIKPDDTIQWVLDVTPPSERRADRLVYRMLHINIAAVHTSSTTFLSSFLCLATMPDVQNELRQEIVEVFRREGGWTKQALTHLAKLDSFIVESLRLCVMSALKMGRVTVKDWQFSDGTKVPKGVKIFCNHYPLVMDESFVKRPTEFDPWRMYKKRQEEGQSTQHQFIMTSETNLTFGHGKHACPGRFFASNELKTLMAQMLMAYDFRVANIPGGLEEIIRGTWYNMDRITPQHAIVEFKDRKNEISEDLKQWFALG
ncbi:cytochrome P450 [Ilyonectria sp. MPI-CAGE-AT-0026]|nr:cytochrome P450 [Ilyonectria sp. MPI-CAGE-AT-0026]